MLPRHVALSISVPLVAISYGWLYTSDLFLASDRHPVLAVTVVLVLVGVWATVFLLHGLLVPRGEGRRQGALAAAEVGCAVAPAAAAEPAVPPTPIPPAV